MALQMEIGGLVVAAPDRADRTQMAKACTCTSSGRVARPGGELIPAHLPDADSAAVVADS
jgi:hypothetical protein